MPTVRDALLDLLRNHGMTTLFGNPGSTEIPFLADLPPDFSYVLSLNEATATAMADGYAQASRRPALVNLHSAVGMGNGMGSLVNAAASHSPVVALVGQQARPLLATPAALANQHPTLLPLGTVKFAAEPTRAEDVPAILAQAIHLATQPPAGPVCVSVPMDDWDRECDPAHYRPTVSRGVVGGGVLGAQAVEDLCDLVAAARTPVLVVGHELDTTHGFDHVARLAEHLAAPVWLSGFSPRCGYPTGHRAFRGTLPMDARSVRSALNGHDLVIALGCPVFTYYPHDPAPALPEGTELVSVTADPHTAARAVAGDTYIGAPDAAVHTLLAQVPPSGRILPERPVLPAPRKATVPGRLSTEEIFDVVARALPAETIVVNEAIRQLPQFWARVPVRRPGGFHMAGAIGLGFGLPGAIGVQLACPDRPVLAILGDGSLQYTVQALWTAAQRRIPLTVLVLNNNEYAILKDWGNRLGTGHIPGLDLPGIDITALARGYGISTTRAETPDQLRQGLDHSLADAHPHLIEAALAPSPYRWNSDGATPSSTTATKSSLNSVERG
ncbi:benzoylformate decarboxylase [Streptomyces sp. NPDC020799]|uniref:benzoylformate decarboxylase n=1 Tax=Streptomyces sp. NPDC020799 TaxID=3365091 RepID=UPI00378DE1C6